MIHLIERCIGMHNNTIVHQTLCKMTIGFSEKLPPGAPINIGVQDGEKCPECCSHVSLRSFIGSGDMSAHGTTKDQVGISQAKHDISHKMDGGKSITIVDGYGEQLLATEQGPERDGSVLTQEYGQYDLEDGHVGGIEDDPYGEGDAVEQRGFQAGINSIPIKEACSYQQGSYFYNRFMTGFKKGTLHKKFPV